MQLIEDEIDHISAHIRRESITISNRAMKAELLYTCVVCATLFLSGVALD